ncbi:hypothetical protein SLEP1_g59981 [Rubroshorea leprosula]|uniref:Uncharacterized protein n=1 Tax=Rubroshorea leprosula TaxID=152421 RepID=A0AAV5MWW4_9ROSI|nr:hypothetical protein SLEP1_g59981 [Rubroshorea leprosula]
MLKSISTETLGKLCFFVASSWLPEEPLGLGCGLAIVTSRRFLPYPRQLTRPQGPFRALLGTTSFRLSPQFDGVACLRKRRQTCSLFTRIPRMRLQGGITSLGWILQTCSVAHNHSIDHHPQNQERAFNLSILIMSGPGKFSRVESN